MEELIVGRLTVTGRKGSVKHGIFVGQMALLVD